MPAPLAAALTAAVALASAATAWPLPQNATKPDLALLAATKANATKQAAVNAPLVLAAEITSAPGNVKKPVVADVVAATTKKRAVVVFQGGGSPHAFTGPTAAAADQCARPRPAFVTALLDAGFPVFTAPAYTNVLPSASTSTKGETGCPPQPPLDAQWNSVAYPTAVGHSGLNFLGWLAAAYGYRHFDIVGYSYGGVAGVATIAALKAAKAGNPGGIQAGAAGAPGFSYAAYAAAVGVTVDSLTTMNSPLLGSPAYDVASNNATFFGPVAAAWGLQYAQLSTTLIEISAVNEGALQFLVTDGHTDAAAAEGRDWDVTVAGALDGVAVTLIGGDYCGTGGCGTSTPPLTDGTVALYSQLVQPCPGCGPPPDSVYVPPNYVPPGAVRKVFPTLHSMFDVKALALLTGQPVPETLSVDRNPEAVQFVVDTVAAAWQRAGVPVRG